MARAISSLRWTSRTPTRCSTSPRIGAGVLDHCANPRWADATARVTSSGPERGKQPITSSESAGLRFSKYAPVRGATHSPAMKFLKFSGMLGVRSWVSARQRHVRAQPQRFRLGAEARQDFPRHEENPPDDEDLGDHMGDAEAPLPGRNARPQPRGDHGGHAQQVKDQSKAAAVRLRPDAGTDTDRDEQAERHFAPGPDPLPGTGPRRAVAPSAGGRRRRLSDRRLAPPPAAQRRARRPPAPW